MLSDAPISPTVPVTDMERAKKFYAETLGLKMKEEDEEGATFECGAGTTLFLYPSAGAGTSLATYAAWEVKDLEAVMKALKGKDVAFEDYDMPGLKTENGIATHDKEKAAWFKDSEGNILALSQRAG
jgi:catechol 2,3-dioxygenase-like lactoylglutathione lyase family enzyme